MIPITLIARCIVRIDCLVLESVFSIDSYLDPDLECNSGCGILDMLVRRRQRDYLLQYNMNRIKSLFFQPRHSLLGYWMTPARLPTAAWPLDKDFVGYTKGPGNIMKLAGNIFSMSFLAIFIPAGTSTNSKAVLLGQRYRGFLAKLSHSSGHCGEEIRFQ